MRVLGIDPGLTRCGLGVIDGIPGRAPTLVAAGVLRTPAGDDIAARLLALEAGIEEWLTAHQPDAMAVELLRMDAPPRPADTADALALAICHLWRGGMQRRLAAAAGSGGGA